MKCGLLGEKLGHSFSPQIHHCLGNYSYDLYEKTPDQLGAFLKSGDFTGLNVTIPYKKAVIEFCDELSPIAQKLGAVNTIVKNGEGKLIGHNTDYYGFKSMLLRSGLDPNGKRVLVLGTGGASVTVQAVLNELGAKVAVISRTGQYNYRNMYRFSATKIIVNTTPVGMYPNNGETLVDLDRFPQLEGVLDLIYNPSRTQLLMDAQKRRLITANGLWMLVAQAKESAEWFLSATIKDDVIKSVYRALAKQTENIVLVGMPGSGKSTIGQLLADALDKPFYDTDVEIKKKTNMSPQRIITKHGEEYFRQVETEVIAELGKLNGAVIATGGGCVTQPRNYPLLRQNGKILWLRRSLYLLPTEGRPLSKIKSVFQLYEERKALYARFCEDIIENNADPAVVVNNILLTEESK